MFKTPLVNISKRDSIGYLMVYRLILLFYSCTLFTILFLYFYIFSEQLLRFCLLVLVANLPLFDLRSENVFHGPYEPPLNVASLLYCHYWIYFTLKLKHENCVICQLFTISTNKWCSICKILKSKCTCLWYVYKVYFVVFVFFDQ